MVFALPREVQESCSSIRVKGTMVGGLHVIPTTPKPRTPNLMNLLLLCIRNIFTSNG